ncbi:MAG: glutamyl-tRNA reductase [Spirochaetota bacterium]|nr:glutamyl-tRNA reductase [Spirochaetota bacterium]
MPLYAVGLNAKTHSVEEREQFALLDQQIVHRCKQLIESEIVDEIVTLSTCNRIEYYFSSNQPIKKIIYELFNHKIPGNLYILKDFEVSHHLFEVVSGLNSQVFGENEILGQVKKAYFLAQENGLTKKQMNILFQKAIYVGKRIRTITDISKCSVSTGGIILDKIKNRFTDLSKINVLLIGAGDISRSVGTSLYHKGVRNIFLCNRSQERGELLAKEIEAKYVPLDELYNTLKIADVVISSTTAPHYLVTKSQEAYLKGHYKLMFDLSVPRDIHPEVNQYENIELFNIDSISSLSDFNKSKREKEIFRAKEILSLENCNFCTSNSLNEKTGCPVNSNFFDFNSLYKWYKKTSV